MKCLKCGAYVYSSDKFCRSCGTTLTQENCQYGDNIPNSRFNSSSCHQEQYDYSTNYSNQKKDSDSKYTNNYDYRDKFKIDYSKYSYAMPNDSGGEDKFIKTYIGSNYESIKKMKFSIPAFIFGPMYLLYRKVWGYAIAIIIICIAASFLLSEGTSEAINIIINIALAFKFKDIYFKQAEEQVENIKQQNLDKTTNELLTICRKKGGTSIVGPVIAVIAFIIFIICFFGIYLTNEINSSKDSDTPVADNIVQKMSYILPNDFEKNYINETGKYKSYDYYTKTNQRCNIIINYMSAYSDESAYLENTLVSGQSNQKVSPILDITLNQNNWKYKQLISTSRDETVYAKIYDEGLYIIRTYDYKYNGQDNLECKTKYNEFLNTLTFQ